VIEICRADDTDAVKFTLHLAREVVTHHASGRRIVSSRDARGLNHCVSAGCNRNIAGEPSRESGAFNDCAV
jgi:hypothetical protein